MKKFSFLMPDIVVTTEPTWEVTTSVKTDLKSTGPGLSEIMLPDGTIVNVDPQGNILKDIVD